MLAATRRGRLTMAQSKDLATETGAMRRIEAAFRYTDTLPAKARRRVLTWAADEYLSRLGVDQEPAE
jgi:hypothetical protein